MQEAGYDSTFDTVQHQEEQDEQKGTPAGSEAIIPNKYPSKHLLRGKTLTMIFVTISVY
jgi:hypothetical protein